MAQPENNVPSLIGYHLHDSRDRLFMEMDGFYHDGQITTFDE